MSLPTGSSVDLHRLLTGHSLEMTGRDVPDLLASAGTLEPGTRISITFLGNEDPDLRVRAARAVRENGYVPVPHLAARRLTAPAELGRYLADLRAVGAGDQVLVIGGDPSRPHGPYPDAWSVITSGLLETHGVRHVSIAGYPEGHPAVAGNVLWAALEDKVAALRERGLDGTVVTQFGFDVDPVLTWLEAVRGRGIDLPVRVGVPGPAGVRRLMRHAARFGVSTSAGIARKYGFSITNLVGTAGPDRFLTELAGRLDPARHGEVAVHFYPFGGLGPTSRWLTGFRAEAGR